MKKLLINLLLATLIMMPTSLFGAEFETPHTFSAGDTISADMMNEIFDYIKNSNKMISASELFGTWSCILYTRTGECDTAIQHLVEKWDNGTDSLYITKSDTLVMIDDGDGTYSYTTPVPNMFKCSDAVHSGFGKWRVKNNVLFITFSSGGVAGRPGVEAETMIVKLKKVSNTKLLMETGEIKAVFAECDKQNLPPIAPATFTASVSGKTVILAWTDNSTDETGFKVLRKDSLKGSYSTVTTTSADATSYSDTVIDAKSYWYRVSATNSNGDSTGSKVVKVDVE